MDNKLLIKTGNHADDNDDDDVDNDGDDDGDDRGNRWIQSVTVVKTAC